MATAILDLPDLSGSGLIVLNGSWRWAIDLGVDLAGIDFVMQVRATEAADDIDVLLLASTADGRLVTDGTTLSCAIDPADLRGLLPGSAVADIVASADGTRLNLCEAGPIGLTVRLGVTR